LSPEVATGKDIDERADIFALGVCLWEMLAGRRLFLGDTDYETVQAVSNADVPSLVGVHPEVDPQIESLILKALARDPDDRFPTAREFGDALASYLFHHQMKVTSYDIANLVKAALERQKSVPPQPMMIDGMIQEELGRFTSLESDANVPIDPSTSFALRPDDGARPLEASDFVDPSNWFAGDAEVETAIENVRDSAPAGATMGWFESKDDSVRVPRGAAVPMGPSLNPPARSTGAPGSQPVMTFRPPGATPVSIAVDAESQPAEAPQAATSAEKKPGGSKVAVIIFGVLVLAAAGVATGWFLTQ
jgi:serine/threonine-protein kinase